MTRISSSRHPRARRAVGRTLLATALLAAAVAVPAAAATPRGTTAAAPVRDEVASQESRLVDHFYGAYIDAVSAEDGGALATALRGFYLTPALRAELDDWEAANHADGVLRAQDVPAAYRVTAGDSGAGHTWCTVRLTWGSPANPTYTYLAVRSDLATGKVSGIRE
ncbi:hypothetical protein E6P78_02585 [Streptomyces sp. A0958]|uniref:hypothetical protein n=1 Tax=Streptomyces sp. A0958 TaxID=2563101 RepID=UPI00109EB06A|nr:hypothetical protein [Streptomyces sp. A0958]THA72186.1 hypothetical protein E6P78_02585 [Streptomyces sp. A0958]